MEKFFLVIGLYLLFLILLCLLRCIKGPTIFDRVVGMGAVGTQAMAVLVIMGFIYKRIDMFIDLALAYAGLNFIGTIVIAKYFIKTKEKEIL